LVVQPAVLLLDEPLGALDKKLREEMQVELRQLQRRLGTTTVFVTHDQEEALTMSDRIAVINKGRIEQLGDSTEIYHSPRTTFVCNFIGQANILEATIVADEGNFTRIRLSSDVEVRIPSDSQLAGLTDLLVSIRPEKIHLQKAKPAGENSFEAEVDEELFKGATDELSLKTPGGLELTAVVANESATQETFHRGEKVWCTLHPSDLVVVRGE
jgi:spermidine/putrescine transport system ATP-binding protein